MRTHQYGTSALTATARVRLDLAQRSFEIEGREEFVRDMFQRLEETLLMAPAAEPGPLPDQPRLDAGPQEPNPLGSFGEFIQRLPSSATEVDRMLAAGFWVQRQSSDEAFATGDANRRLTEQGVKLGNPSQCVRQSLNAKRVFAVQRGRFRVSLQGRQHLRQLLGSELVPE